MSNAAVPQCTHVKTNGEVCGSPAVSGSNLCYHHSTVKTALAKAKSNGKAPEEGFAPIPFIFPEDRASMQLNFFLLLEAFNEQRIDQRTYRLMLSLLKAMAKNLGKTGSLAETSDEAVSVEAASKETASVEAASDQKNSAGGPTGPAFGLRGEHKPTSGLSGEHNPASGLPLVDLKASAIAPESCFSSHPQVHVRNRDTHSDFFRRNTLDLAKHGFRQAAQPLAR